MLSDTARLLLFPALMAFAACSDLLTMTISNRITLMLAVGFAAAAAFSGMPMHGVLVHVGAAALVLTVAFVFFARGWIGAGDAKLAAATALWFGFDHLLDYALYASVFGGILTYGMLRFRVIPLPPVLAAYDWAKRLHRSDSGVPYGIALAAAALMIYPDTIWMHPG
jgi:prepilin peptidase CpaA